MIPQMTVGNKRQIWLICKHPSLLRTSQFVNLASPFVWVTAGSHVGCHRSKTVFHCLLLQTVLLPHATLFEQSQVLKKAKHWEPSCENIQC